MNKNLPSLTSFVILALFSFLISSTLPNVAFAAANEEQKIIAADPEPGDGFGTSVSLSGDGSRMVIGSPSSLGSQGSAYIFSRSGTTWTLEQKITASDGAAGDFFGVAVSISGDGTRLVVDASGVGSFRGAAYIFSRSGTTWTEEQKITAASDSAAGDLFGNPISMSSDGSRLVAGAEGSGGGQGAAYVFSRSGTIWTREQKITSLDGAPGDLFGISLAISSDSTRIGVGAQQKNGGEGAAYIFSRSGTTWTEEQAFTDTGGMSNFGASVAFSVDTTRVAVGANAKNNAQGVAFIFSRSGTTWTQEQEITSNTIADGDNFGFSVSLAGDGANLVVGAPNENSIRGAAYIFARSGTTWTQTQQLLASDGVDGDNFGSPVAFSSDGLRIGIGGAANNNGQGAAYVFSNEIVVPPPPVPPSSPSRSHHTSSPVIKVTCPEGDAYNTTTGQRCTSFIPRLSFTPVPLPLPVPSSHVYVFSNILVKEGTRGGACVIWQMFFNDKINAELKVDGICGKLTMAAARIWQASVGLVPDGLLGPLSRAKAS